MTSEESVSGVVTDSEWYQLKLVRVSAAIREIQKDEERQKQAQLEGAEEAKRQAEVAAKEKVRKDAEEAEEAKRRQELAQEQEKRESIRREQALDAELELKLKQDRQKAEQAEQQKAGGKKRFAVYQHSSEGFRAVRQGIVWWYLPVGFVVGVIPYAIGDWVGLSDPGGAMAMPAMLIWALATVASFKMSSFTARGLRKKGYELVDTVKANSEDEAIKFAKAEN
jgi:flagellar biosynthesis GTPase FlhF